MDIVGEYSHSMVRRDAVLHLLEEFTKEGK